MEKTLSKKLESAGFTWIEIAAVQASILFTTESSYVVKHSIIAEYDDDTITFKRLFGELIWDSLINLRQDIED